MTVVGLLISHQLRNRKISHNHATKEQLYQLFSGRDLNNTRAFARLNTWRINTNIMFNSQALIAQLVEQRNLILV